MCQRLPAPAGAVRAEATPPDRPLSTNKKKIQMRNTRPASDFAPESTAGAKATPPDNPNKRKMSKSEPASDFATESTAGVKATPPDHNPSKLKMSKSWPDPDFARESTASGSGSPGAQGHAADTCQPRARGRREARGRAEDATDRHGGLAEAARSMVPGL